MSNEAFTTGIEYPHPFDEYAVRLAGSATRYLCILSPRLDHSAFDSPALAEALSALARASRQTQVRILLNDPRQVIARGHRLLQLARRLPSTVHMQTLAEHPDWDGATIVIRDHNGVLFLPGDAETNGFYEPDSRASTQRHLELFDELWRHSAKDPDLRVLSI